MAIENKKQLAADSLGILESIIMGTAGAAPAFSISATTVALVAAVGTLAPASILYCGLFMFGITLAFIHLNKVVVNAGASYAWVSKIFGKKLGFFAGWAVLTSSAIFMVSGSIPAATATLLLFDHDLAQNPAYVTAVAAIWVSFISAVTLKGIKPTSYLQSIMTGVEVIILIAIIIGGAIAFARHPIHQFSFSWLSLTGFTPSLFATGALSAVFLYWGWDVTLNLNEETKNAQRIPGLGAFWSVVILILVFVAFVIVALLVLSDAEILNSNTNILFIIADKIFPRPWSYLAVLSIILSSIGTLETTILQFTRTMFAQGRDQSLNIRYSKLHSTWNTPWVAIFFIWGFGMIFLFLSSYFSSVYFIIKVSVNAIGFQVAFYYSLTGFACAWYYRKMWRNLYELLIYVMWPVLSSMFLLSIAAISFPTFDDITCIVGLGGLMLGIFPFMLNYYRKDI